MNRRILFFLILTAFAAPAFAQGVALEEMTWPEVRDALAAGKTTVIVPTGGTEQNGPHIALGKHNWIVGRNALEIAGTLGNALVTPVLAYVPEGPLEKREGHMKFPGTISVSPATFASVLEDTARGLKLHGFKNICFIGDHGDSIPVQQQVADKLSAEWAGQGVRVLNVTNYYKNNGQQAWFAKHYPAVKDGQAHGGFADTAEIMFIRPSGVRARLVKPYGPEQFDTLGTKGDPTGASATAGEELLKFKVNAAVEQIRRDLAQAQ